MDKNGEGERLSLSLFTFFSLFFIPSSRSSVCSPALSLSLRFLFVVRCSKNDVAQAREGDSLRRFENSRAERVAKASEGTVLLCFFGRRRRAGEEEEEKEGVGSGGDGREIETTSDESKAKDAKEAATAIEEEGEAAAAR